MFVEAAVGVVVVAVADVVGGVVVVAVQGRRDKARTSVEVDHIQILPHESRDDPVGSSTDGQGTPPLLPLLRAASAIEVHSVYCTRLVVG